MGSKQSTECGACHRTLQVSLSWEVRLAWHASFSLTSLSFLHRSMIMTDYLLEAILTCRVLVLEGRRDDYLAAI